MTSSISPTLALALAGFAQALLAEDETRQTRRRPRANGRSKAGAALQYLLDLPQAPEASFEQATDALWTLYESHPPGAPLRHQVATLLFELAQRRDVPFSDAVEAAHTLYHLARRKRTPQEKDRAIRLLLEQARWPGISMEQSIEAALALGYASPFHSQERNQAANALIELAQRPHLSAEDALAVIDNCTLASTAALVRQQEESKHRLLLQLVERDDLTAEQVAKVQDALRSYKQSCQLVASDAPIAPKASH
jgi:hypothetical protein